MTSFHNAFFATVDTIFPQATPLLNGWKVITIKIKNMKNKIFIVCLAFFGYFATQASEAPILNFDLPIEHSKTQTKPDSLKKTNSTIVLATSRKFSISGLLVLSSTKNSELKAVIKRKTYGLRYTKTW